MPNLDFDGDNTIRGTHGLHAFAAKCPPQVVAHALRYYSRPGDSVLDPMVGSGTTLVQARIMGRNALGYDFDPLACLVSRVKSRPLSDGPIEKAYESIARRARQDLDALRKRKTPEAVRRRALPPEFPNRDYWFDSSVSRALALLSFHIRNSDASEAVREFMWVALSSLVLARTSVANARDIVHSRHHHWNHDEAPDVIATFNSRVSRMRRQMEEFRRLCGEADPAKVNARLGDARSLRLPDESVDLVFTSPPYTTALDYPRAHFLAVPWLEEALGINLSDYLARGEKYIGSERGRLGAKFAIDSSLLDLCLATNVLTKIGATSARQANLTQRYLLDMRKAIRVMARVLRSGRHAVLVVCPSHVRSMDIPTHELLVELATREGLLLKKRHVRTISCGRRVMPYMRSFGRRMSTEYVLILQKITRR